MKPKVTKLTMTCNFCPSQWEGETEDGRKVYVRYRWGVLAVGIGNDPLGKDYGNIYHEDCDDAFGGILSYKELRERTDSLVNWPDLPDGITEWDDEDLGTR